MKFTADQHNREMDEWMMKEIKKGTIRMNGGTLYFHENKTTNQWLSSVLRGNEWTNDPTQALCWLSEEEATMLLDADDPNVRVTEHIFCS